MTNSNLNPRLYVDADFVLYQIYHDERELGGPISALLDKEAPTLKKLVQAVEGRPRIAEYMKSDRCVMPSVRSRPRVRTRC